MLVFVAIALYVAAWQAILGPPTRIQDFHTGWIAALSMAVCYETGYRNIRRNVSPVVFALVFLLPTILQLIGMAIRLVRLYS